MANLFDDFGVLSLDDALALRESQKNMLNIPSQYIEEAPAFTKSGRDLVNPSTSKAVMQSASKAFPLEAGAEGKTVSGVVKHIQGLNNSNAMLDAIIAAKTPLPETSVNSSKGLNLPKSPGLLSKIHPILNLISGATYSANLNEGEDIELAKRRQQPATRN